MGSNLLELCKGVQQKQWLNQSFLFQKESKTSFFCYHRPEKQQTLSGFDLLLIY